MRDEGISLKEKLRRIERAEIRSALDASGWVKAKAARKLGITERMIGYKIRKYGIDKEVHHGEMTKSHIKELRIE